VPRLGLDGVHLSDGARQLRAVRKALGRDAIVGAFAGASRHEGMTAGELGADYVSFGPVGTDDAAPLIETLAWWSEMIEVPLVAEGGITPELAAATLAAAVDFVALGDELWSSPQGPEPALRAIAARLKAAG
jgi:thiamine-phosphate pyrophosphorylase